MSVKKISNLKRPLKQKVLFPSNNSTLSSNFTINMTSGYNTWPCTYNAFPWIVQHCRRNKAGTRSEAEKKRKQVM